ncbi:MAG: hypothetical protein OEM26_00180 [Saprospiraceae bacterium]|nr:hypothetical protein [Saprospiraceae bacterium]
MEAQHIMVSEQHGIREVCRFTEYLAFKTADLGFSKLAIETSPFVAEELDRLIPHGIEGIAKLQDQFPFAVPFYNNQDDARLLEVVNQAWEGQGDFWGLDQVFVVEPRLIFNKLKQLASDSVSKALATDYLERSISSFSKALETQKFEEVILFGLNDDVLSELRDAFNSNPGAVAMIDALAETRENLFSMVRGS